MEVVIHGVAVLRPDMAMSVQVISQLHHLVLGDVLTDASRDHPDPERAGLHADSGRAHVHRLPRHGHHPSPQHADRHDVQLLPGHRGWSLGFWVSWRVSWLVSK